ncbi:CU044_5270 family protein [Actinomadura sp. NPDC047616]|uniref:CU044_5270 family protein n=1 Tax=Actinomadura sp. NPDC047616 TaxID=3155914 RepID=UPI0033EFD7FE
MRHRAGIAVSAVTAVAAATGGVVVLGTGGDRPGTTVTRPPAVRPVSAQQVLGRAAQAAESRPAVRPRPDQWWYTKAVETGVAAEHGPKPHFSEAWIKLDGTQDASLLRGKLVIYRHTGIGAKRARAEYDRLVSLPADPRKLRSIIYKEVDAMPARDRMFPDRDGQAFRNAAQMLWDAPVTMSPATQAALYRVLATIPGVQIDTGVRDGAGRPAIALSRGFGEQFLLDPVTYQMVARRTVNTGRNAPRSPLDGRADPRYNVPKGTIMNDLTRVVTKLVDRPGQR